MKELLINKLKEKFQDFIEEIIDYFNELTFVISKKKILDVCYFLKNNEDLKFDYLVDICGVDRFKKENRFEVVYNIWSEKLKYRIRLRVKVDEKDLQLDSVTSIWKSADWYERETYDMFGIVFLNHPDLRRIYMPEEFEYFPLRKDFPLIGIPDSLPLPRRN
ncbi:MAG TPA: NADH-quinone oxidoreductase subunit C [Bacteroidota bacterium]|jgi:NADH-quinone oxidoreductase subunit C|nr:NADH-quinone oxidoreductase subunit C [Bacteroidota bacterium]